jgi:hypothetical protein
MKFGSANLVMRLGRNKTLDVDEELQFHIEMLGPQIRSTGAV